MLIILPKWNLRSTGDFISLKVFSAAAPAAATVRLQSYPTLCNPIDSSLPGYPVPGILQARTLERVAISFSSVWKWKVKVKSLSRVRLFSSPWTAACQAPPSMGFSRQEYWSGVPLPSLPSSPTRDQTTAVETQCLNHWTTREVPIIPKSLDELCLCPPGLSSAVGDAYSLEGKLWPT